MRRAIRVLIAARRRGTGHQLHPFLRQSGARAARRARSPARSGPIAFISVGSDILREVREFERGTTAALNGYVQPIMSRYLGRLQKELKLAAASANELLVMQGNGGMMAARPPPTTPCRP